MSNPFIGLFVKHVNCDKTTETSAHIITPYEGSMHLVLRHREWSVGDALFYVRFWAKLTLPLQKQ